MAGGRPSLRLIVCSVCMHRYLQSVWHVHPVSFMPRSKSGAAPPSFGPPFLQPSTHPPVAYVTSLYPSLEHPSKPQLYRHRWYRLFHRVQSSWGGSARAAGATPPRITRITRITNDRRIPPVTARPEQCRTVRDSTTKKDGRD